MMPIVEGITGAITAVADAVTKGIPSDEQKYAAFKLRHPKKHARLMEGLYQRNKKFLRWNPEVSIDVRVELINSDLPPSAREAMKEMLRQDLKREVTK